MQTLTIGALMTPIERAMLALERSGRRWADFSEISVAVKATAGGAPSAETLCRALRVLARRKRLSMRVDDDGRASYALDHQDQAVLPRRRALASANA